MPGAKQRCKEVPHALGKGMKDSNTEHLTRDTVHAIEAYG